MSKKRQVVRNDRRDIRNRSRALSSRTYSKNSYGYEDRNMYRPVGQHEGVNEGPKKADTSPFSQQPFVADNPYSRHVVHPDYSKQRKKRRRHRVVFICLAAVLAFVLAGAGVAFAYINRISHNLSEDVDDELLNALDTPEEYVAGDPFYMLLMGVDKSQERVAMDGSTQDNYRSDSMILARIDPKQEIVTLVSLHRDTLIDMGEYGKQKLNAAHEFGGPAYAVEVVSELAGVPITHYAEIDFDGFKTVVDALGGVEVDVPMEIDDDLAGGHLDAGLQNLNGEQALILARSRHSYDEYGDGDKFRAANQRMVIGAIASKLLKSDPMTVASTIEALSQYITTTITIEEILNLAGNFHDFDASTGLYSAMEPTEGYYDEKNDAWYEQLNEKAWKAMMERVDSGLPPTRTDEIDENSGAIFASTGSGDISANGEVSSAATSKPDGSRSYSGTANGTRSGFVSVKNGMGEEGVGDEVAAKVASLGYSTEASNASNFDYEMSVVVYSDPANQAAAQEIADLLGIDVVTDNDTDNYDFEGDFLVLLGADWALQ